ncbi:MAG: hypothetical protein ACFFD4_35750 [Candidatus Odinarchaeota archaeon]
MDTTIAVIVLCIIIIGYYLVKQFYEKDASRTERSESNEHKLNSLKRHQISLMVKYNAPNPAKADIVRLSGFPNYPTYVKAQKQGINGYLEYKRYDESGFPNYQMYKEALRLGATSLEQYRVVVQYDAPDYKTAVMIKSGDFPDFTTYKRAQSFGLHTMKQLEFLEKTGLDKNGNYTFTEFIKAVNAHLYQLRKRIIVEKTTLEYRLEEKTSTTEKSLQALRKDIIETYDMVKGFSNPDSAKTKELCQELLNAIEKILQDVIKHKIGDKNDQELLKNIYRVIRKYGKSIDVSILYEELESLESSQESSQLTFKDLYHFLERIERETGSWEFDGRFVTITFKDLGQTPLFSSNTCHVCKREIKTEEELVNCPECIHPFHKAHLAEWVKVKGTCPVCKKHINF